MEHLLQALWEEKTFMCSIKEQDLRKFWKFAWIRQEKSSPGRQLQEEERSD